ncbi:MAG: GNAT family N-acetyltransferase [Anaerolineae bacterium]|jgi:RimJ/RimL family protein N-acetyltransferase
MPLEGEMVVLREERRRDLKFLRGLRNDLQTQAWSKTLPPAYTAPMYTKRFEAQEFSYDPGEGRFVIIHKDTGQRAGYISYTGLERRFSTTIGLIVAKEFWGSGIALDSQEVLLHFLFQELGMRVVRLWTHSGNPRAVELAKKSGFQIAARTRETIFKAGKRYDNLVLDLLREEYFARHPEMKDDLPPIVAREG